MTPPWPLNRANCVICWQFTSFFIIFLHLDANIMVIAPQSRQKNCSIQLKLNRYAQHSFIKILPKEPPWPLNSANCVFFWQFTSLYTIFLHLDAKILVIAPQCKQNNCSIQLRLYKFRYAEYYFIKLCLWRHLGLYIVHIV